MTKILSEWALAAGRSLQSKQTGYVHYFYGESKQPYDTIPLVENGLFILALFRSRLMEQVQEGKELLNALLHFQSPEGNFPVYLHEYPRCPDATIGLQLLAPFYWILHQFGSVLGAPLKSKLHEATQKILEHALAEHQRKNFPYFYAVRLAAAQAAFRHQHEHLEELAKNQLEGWSSTKQLGELLIGLQMVYPSLKDSPWHSLWKRMEETWHFQTSSYCGPCVREWQDGVEPKVNLYDLFGGYFSDQFSHRAHLMAPVHLYGALIQPSQDRFTPHPDSCYTLLEKNGPPNPSIDKTHTPFRLLWGNQNRTHTLICQGGSYEKVHFSENEQEVQILFDLPENESSSKKEVEFFLDYQPGIRFYLNRIASNTFELGRKLEIEVPGRSFFLQFDLIEGEGQFLGHIMRGNRPSQTNLKGDNRFQSYDWSIFLRTIRRQGKCRVRASIILESAF